MRAVYTQRFLNSYAMAPPEIQRAVDRRVALLLQDLRHPSLRGRVTRLFSVLLGMDFSGCWRCSGAAGASKETARF